MLYTAEEVLDFLEEEDVRFVRLAFCDIFGTPRNISIPPAELKSAFQTGVSFDASSVPGFTDVSHSDLFLYPDPTTLALFPWRPSNGRVRQSPAPSRPHAMKPSNSIVRAAPSSPAIAS